MGREGKIMYYSEDFKQSVVQKALMPGSNGWCAYRNRPISVQVSNSEDDIDSQGLPRPFPLLRLEAVQRPVESSISGSH